MHFDRRFLIIVACSLVWGTIVSLVFYRAAAGSRSPVVEKTLVVAALALAPGASIGAEAVRITRVPEKLFPRGGYSRVEDVVGRPVISSIQPDEPVVESRLAARGSGFGVAPMIPTGMRAVAVKVNEVAGVAGFILPGMRVDVLVTGRPPGADDTYTATVLQNVTVLSAGQAVETDGKSQSMSVPVVTLLVDPMQAESLTLAASEGRIQLVLRNSSDQKVEPMAGRQMRELYAHGNPAPAAIEQTPRPVAKEVRATAPPRAVPARVVVASPPPAPAFDTMILLHGNQKTVETFPIAAKSSETKGSDRP